MNRKLENKIVGWAAVVIVLIIAVSFLCSCGSRKTITETITEYVHDTIKTVKVDTIRDVKVVTLHDTVRSEEKHYITLNNVGDTIKEVHHYDVREKVIVVDSTNRYQAKVDSLQNIIDKQKEVKEKIVKKGIQVPWWAWILTPLILVLGIGFLAKKLVEKKWHIT